MSYALTTSTANIRRGPGTGFEVSGQAPEDTPLTVFGRTDAGDWLQVRTPERTGGWISAGLVALNVAVAQILVPGNVPVPAAVAPIAAPVEAPATAGALSGSEVQITEIQYVDGDETITITNNGSVPVDLSSWRIWSYGHSTCTRQNNQIFTVPESSVLQPGASVRVHSERSAQQSPPTDLLWTTEHMWSNERDRVDLLDAGGNVVDTYAYGGC